MFDIILQVKDTLNSYNQALQVLSLNLANFTTDGYKTQKWNFQTSFPKMLKAATDKVNGIQFSGSPNIGSVSSDFQQGKLSTGNEYSAAIQGQTLFITTSNFGVGDNINYYTRNGRFQIGIGGKYLVDSSGRMVYGYKTNADGDPISSTMEPIDISAFEDVGFDDNGQLVSGWHARNEAENRGDTDLPDTTPIYKLAIAKFANPNGLTLVDGTSYSASQVAGAIQVKPAGSDPAFGVVYGQKIEASNVVITDQNVESLILQRAFSANDSVMSTVNKMLQSFIQSVAG